MKYFSFLVIASITLFNSNALALGKAKPNGEVIFIIDLTASFTRHYQTSLSYLSYLLKKSKGRRFDAAFPPKKFSIIGISAKNDGLIVQKVLRSTKDVNFSIGKYKKALNSVNSRSSNITDAFFLAEEVTNDSNLKKILVAFTDLEQGSFEGTFSKVSKTLPSFTKAFIIGVGKDRRKWEQELIRKNIKNTKLYHIEEDVKESLDKAFNELFGGAKLAKVN